MSAVLATQPVATLDEFLSDPLIRSEFQAVIERLMSDAPTELNGYMSASLMRVKVCENREMKAGTREPRRTTWLAEDVAALILKAWREYRP